MQQECRQQIDSKRKKGTSNVSDTSTCGHKYQYQEHEERNKKTGDNRDTKSNKNIGKSGVDRNRRNDSNNIDLSNRRDVSKEKDASNSRGACNRRGHSTEMMLKQ